MGGTIGMVYSEYLVDTSIPFFKGSNRRFKQPARGPPSQAFSHFPYGEGVFLNLGLFPPKNTLKPQVSSRQKRPIKSLPWSLDWSVKFSTNCWVKNSIRHVSTSLHTCFFSLFLPSDCFLFLLNKNTVAAPPLADGQLRPNSRLKSRTKKSFKTFSPLKKQGYWDPFHAEVRKKRLAQLVWKPVWFEGQPFGFFKCFFFVAGSFFEIRPFM